MSRSDHPSTPGQIATLYQKALALQDAGRLEEALALYRQLIAANPKLAEVHFQVARIFASAGHFAKALPHVRAAQRIRPKEPAIWALWAEVLNGLGDEAELGKFANALRRSALPGPAKARIRRMLNPGRTRAAAGLPEGLDKEIEALIGKGKAGEAETRIMQTLKRQPRSAALLHLLARAQMADGRNRAALASLDKALAIDPGLARAHLERGRLLLGTGHPMQAVESLRRAVHLAPDLAEAWSALGRGLLQIDQPAEAARALDRAEELKPALGETHFNRGMLLVREERDDAAVEAFRRAIALGHDDARTHAMLARALGALRREDEALEHFDKAIARDPEYAFAHARRAVLRQARGEFEAAEADFRRAMELEPENGETYRVFSASHKFAPDDPLLTRMQEIWARDDLSPKDRSHLGFALAKAMEDIGAHDRVFTYLRPANDLMHQRFPYDIATRRREIDAIKEAFEGFDFSSPFPGGDDSFAPIFVTGMPRSGTTLVEQILASHSTVTGAGEIGEFARRSYMLLAGGGEGRKNISGEETGPAPRLRHIGRIPPEEITALGRHYTRYMRARFPDAERITDKSIQTYLMMGLVRLALPRAHVVVVRRDPRDNLLSIYRNVFQEGTHRYAYRLRDLGLYYRMFEEMIDWWRERLPAGWFHEISYDELTADPEGQSRALLAACGLEWEDRCLDFHQNRNRVDTLSVYQVRQPIYRSSVHAWERYRDELEELFEALGTTP